MDANQKVIGLMSGTSLDGVDVGLLETDGQDHACPGPGLMLPYDQAMRAGLREALAIARTVGEGTSVPEPIQNIERQLTDWHARAVAALLDKTKIEAGAIALIGFHGQTILHRPHQHRTWQIGDGARLAELTGIAVVDDFRTNDVKAGGQGAPLMPLYHAVLAHRTGLAQPIVVVNIGGVAQVTWVDGDQILAFDTGPGNAALDDWMLSRSDDALDQGGAFAATGTVNEAALTKLMADPFFTRPPPKSLDRMDFGMEAAKGLSAADGAATLTAFTAASLAAAQDHFPRPAANWIVCGGGRHNATMMAMIKARVRAPVLKAEDVGWDGDLLEAQGFAYLAMRVKLGLPLSLPSTTGVSKPMAGGKLHYAP
jgi:anhydro-N-acetylmuramic acid kinase